MYSSIFSMSKIKDEPYLTQIFSYLLQSDKDFCFALLNEVFELKVETILSVTPEKSMNAGRPDIVIDLPGNKKIAIENKITAGFTNEQIKKYKDESQIQAVFLIYHNISDIEQASLADKAISWSELYFFINSYLSKIDDNKSINRFLLYNFIIYLKERGLAVEKVGWEIINGAKALQNLIEQIKAALESQKEKGRLTAAKTVTNSTSQYTGWVVSLGNEDKFYIYLLYHPTIIFGYFQEFEDCSSNCIPLIESIPELGSGWEKSLWYLHSLRIENEHFLSSSAEEQFSIIKEFVSVCISKYNEE